jgi:hypothetical protein
MSPIDERPDELDAQIAALLARVPSAPSSPSEAPGAFADRVLARVAVTPQVLPAAIAIARDPLPWWVRPMIQPAGVLSVVLAGLFVVFAAPLRAAAGQAPEWSARILASGAAALGPWIEPLAASFGGGPLVDAFVALAVLPLVGVLSFGLYRLGVGVAEFGLAHPAATLARVRRP